MDTKTVGLIATLSLLLGIVGTTVILSPEEIDNSYVCSVNENVGVYHRLSSTNKTAYYYDETGKERYNRCVGGVWIPLRIYLNMTNKTLNDVMPLNVSAIEECTDVKKRFRYIINLTQTIYENGTGQILKVENLSTFNYSYRNISVCEESAFVYKGKTIPYDGSQKSCLREGDIICCWDKSDGGENIEHRAPKWRAKIRSGECGQCRNYKTDVITSQGEGCSI